MEEGYTEIRQTLIYGGGARLRTFFGYMVDHIALHLVKGRKTLFMLPGLTMNPATSESS